MNFKELNSQPSTTPETSPFTGRTFIRDWPKICPTCEDVFFARRLESEYHEPYRKDPEPPIVQRGELTIVDGIRETCGHPQCHEAEVQYQARRSPDWARAHYKAYAGNHGETSPTPTKLTKGLAQVGR